MLDKFPHVGDNFFKTIFHFVDELPKRAVVTINGCMCARESTYINAQMIASDATGSTIYEIKHSCWNMRWPEDIDNFLEGLTDPSINVHLQILPRSVLVIDNYKDKYHIEISSPDLGATDFVNLISTPLGNPTCPDKFLTIYGVRFTAHVQAIDPIQAPVPVPKTPRPVSVPVETQVPQEQPTLPEQEPHVKYDIDSEAIKSDNRKTNLESVLGEVIEQAKEITDHIRKEKEKDPNAFNPPEEVQPEMPHSLDDLKAMTGLHMAERTTDGLEPEDPVFNQADDDSVEFEDVMEEEPPRHDINSPQV